MYMYVCVCVCVCVCVYVLEEVWCCETEEADIEPQPHLRVSLLWVYNPDAASHPDSG